MSRAAPVNARQLEVLGWIAEGCPDGVMKDFTFKTTAVALQGRGLVAVTRKGGIWRAAITDAGNYYLQHGAYPPARKVSSRTVAAPARTMPAGQRADAPVRAPASADSGPAVQSGTGQQADDLVMRVLQANGVLVVDTENDTTDYEHLVAAARTAARLPYGKRLRSRSTGQWWSRQREIYLDEDFAAQITARPVPVPARSDRVASGGGRLPGRC